MPPASASWWVTVSWPGTCCWTCHTHSGFITGAGGTLVLDPAVPVLWEKPACGALGGGIRKRTWSSTTSVLQGNPDHPLLPSLGTGQQLRGCLPGWQQPLGILADVQGFIHHQTHLCWCFPTDAWVPGVVSVPWAPWSCSPCRYMSM